MILAFTILISVSVTLCTSFDMRRYQQDLKRFEGVKDEVYKDHLGYKTCCVGHLLVRGDRYYGSPVGTMVPAWHRDAYLRTGTTGVQWEQWCQHGREMRTLGQVLRESSGNNG